MTWGAEGRGGFTRDVLDGLTDPVVLMAAVRDDAGVIVDFTFVDANAAALVINRTTFDELIGDTLLARFPEHGPSGLIHAYAQVIETGEPLGLNDQPYAHEFYPGDVQYFDIRAAKVGDAITLTWRDRSDLHADRQALEAERARSRTTLDGIMDPVVLFTPIRDGDQQITDFAFAEVNQAACDYNQVTREELQESLLSERYPDMWPLGMFDRFVDVTEHGGSLVADSWPYTSSLAGVERILDLRGHQVTSGLAVTWRDVTDRHQRDVELEQAREAAQLGEEHVRAVLESMLDPQVVLAAVRDEAGRIVDFEFVDANRAASEFNGVEHGELIGVRLLGKHPAAGATGLFDDYVRVVETGEPIIRDDWSYPQDLLGGEVRNYDVRAVRFRDGVSQTWRDVTDRYRQAQALADSQTRYRLLAENATDVVFEMRADGVIGWASPSAERVLGRSPAEIVGTPIWKLIPADALPEVRERWNRTGQGLAPVLKADGSSLWGSFRVTLTKGPGGESTGAIIGMTDVSAVIRANDEAAAARAVEERTQLSMDEAAIGLLMSDVAGVVTYANAALARMARTTPEAIVGMSLLDGAVPDEQPAFQSMIGRVLSGESDREHARRSLRHMTGTDLWVDTFVSPVRDAGGRVDGLLVQIVDVTAEVANREALVRNAEHFRLLAENASDVVYETDRAGQIVWVSPSVLPALGWEPTSLVGTVAFDLIHAEDREWAARERAEVYEGVDKSGLVARFTRIDGGVRHMSVSARVLRDAEGAVSGAVVGLHDVTTEVLMQNRIKRSERLFRTAMLGAPQGMAIANAQDQVTDLNAAFEAILGIGKVAILGLRLADFVVPSDPPIPTCAERLLASGEDRIVQHEHELTRVDAPRAWIEHSVSAIRDDDGTVLLFVHHVVDVTERRLREDDLGHRAHHDVLTGLLNRDGLLTRLSERMPVHGPTSLAVLYCDLDNLKPINDQHGHAAGDAVLVELARRMESHLRRGDLVARLGGDEFVIVLDRVSSHADAMAVAEKICEGARGPVPFDGIDLPASVSMGIAVSEPADTVESLLSRADSALYRAKAGGRARVST